MFPLRQEGSDAERFREGGRRQEVSFGTIDMIAGAEPPARPENSYVSSLYAKAKEGGREGGCAPGFVGSNQGSRNVENRQIIKLNWRHEITTMHTRAADVRLFFALCR